MFLHRFSTKIGDFIESLSDSEDESASPISRLKTLPSTSSAQSPLHPGKKGLLRCALYTNACHVYVAHPTSPEPFPCLLRTKKIQKIHISMPLLDPAKELNILTLPYIPHGHYLYSAFFVLLVMTYPSLHLTSILSTLNENEYCIYSCTK